MPINTAVVLAAGSGTRLAPYTESVNKEMVIIGARPIIDNPLRTLSYAGIEKVFIVISKGKEQIMNYVKDGREWGMDVAYLFQDFSRGSGLAKAIQCAEPHIAGPFVAIFADYFVHPAIFLAKMIEMHKKNNASATVNLVEKDDPTQVGIVKLDSKGRVTMLIEKPTLSRAEDFKLPNGKYLSIAGCMVLSDVVFDYIERTDVGAKGEYQITDTLGLMLRDGCLIMGYRMDNLFCRDIGTMEGLQDANRYYYDQIHKRKIGQG